MIPSQKRLTHILLTLGVMGTLLIGLLWWDSTRYWSVVPSYNSRISSANSLVEFNFLPPSFPSYGAIEFTRYPNPTQSFSNGHSLLPKPVWETYFILIPYYLILLTYLAAHIIIWLVLMNRLARRHSTNQPISAE